MGALPQAGEPERCQPGPISSAAADFRVEERLPANYRPQLNSILPLSYSHFSGRGPLLERRDHALSHDTSGTLIYIRSFPLAVTSVRFYSITLVQNQNPVAVWDLIKHSRPAHWGEHP
jgi:hypothetical protein